VPNGKQISKRNGCKQDLQRNGKINKEYKKIDGNIDFFVCIMKINEQQKLLKSLNDKAICEKIKKM